MKHRSLMLGFIVSLILSTASALAEGDGLRRRSFIHEFNFGAGPACVYFFDADSTLRPAMRPGVPVNHPDEVVLLPFVAEEIRRVNQMGCLVWVISNQAGVGDGHATMANVDAALLRTVELLAAEGAIVHGYDFAEFRDDDRKPGTGMMRRLEDLIRQRTGRASGDAIDRQRSVMVGDAGWQQGRKALPARNGRPAREAIPADPRPDGTPGFSHSNSDRLAAERFGIRFIEAAEFFRWFERLGARAIDTVADLNALMQPITPQSQSRYPLYIEILTNALRTDPGVADGTPAEIMAEEAFHAAVELKLIADGLKRGSDANLDLPYSDLRDVNVIRGAEAREEAAAQAAGILAGYVNVTLSVAGYGKPAPLGFWHRAYHRYLALSTLQQKTSAWKSAALAATHAVGGMAAGAGIMILSQHLGYPADADLPLWGAMAGFAAAAANRFGGAAVLDRFERGDRARQSVNQSAALTAGLNALAASLRAHGVHSTAEFGVNGAEFTLALSAILKDAPMDVDACAEALR